MYYPDLGTECQIASGPRVRAVGWLSVDAPFSTGPLDERVASLAERLTSKGWIHVAVAGPHECELCRGVRSSSNLLVPGDDVIYVAPAMISHYMRVHAYLPPAEFRDAVVRCPEPPSDAYFAALKPFLEVFSFRSSRAMTEEELDRLAIRHRAHLEEFAAREAAEAKRKKFTWD